MTAKKPHPITRHFKTGRGLAAWLKHNGKRVTFAVVTAKAKVKHPTNRAHRALDLAAHFVGLKEHPAGSNIQMFGKWYGENGVPWCAIFISYVLSHVGRPFKYAFVPAIVADARAAKNGLRPLTKDRVNAAIAAGHPVLACYDWNHDGQADHVEFVSSVTGATVHAIGGNTGPADWSNGGEVAREARPISYVEQFVEVLG